MPFFSKATVSSLFALLIFSPPGMAQTIRYLEPDPALGCSSAVVVADAPLIHTTQLFPLTENHPGIVPGDILVQVTRLIARLQTTLRENGSDLNRLAKLNLYLSDEKNAALIRPQLATLLPNQHLPAVSLVVTPLPHSAALIALDAVAVATSKAPLNVLQRTSLTATMPPGGRLYISGQAEPGTLREATRKTLEKLTATLRHCGRSDQDIVQVKCFLQPMTSVTEVQEEIHRYYSVAAPPPITYVQWRSNTPIEIELVAWGGPPRTDSADTVEYLTPPGLKASPVYSRVARINRGSTIYCGDFYGPPSSDNDIQLEASFQRLQHVLKNADSDFQHLVKATYYVTDDEISRALGAIRPKYYDPTRPPAASKALIQATGRPAARFTMDMIATPTK